MLLRYNFRIWLVEWLRKRIYQKKKITQRDPDMQQKTALQSKEEKKKWKKIVLEHLTELYFINNRAQ